MCGLTFIQMLLSANFLFEGAVSQTPVSVTENLQSTQVASNDDSDVAIQIAGGVIKYGMVRFQLNHSHSQDGVQHLLACSRSGHEGKHKNIYPSDCAMEMAQSCMTFFPPCLCIILHFIAVLLFV